MWWHCWGHPTVNVAACFILGGKLWSLLQVMTVMSPERRILTTSQRHMLTPSEPHLALNRISSNMRMRTGTRSRHLVSLHGFPFRFLWLACMNYRYLFSLICSFTVAVLLFGLFGIFFKLHAFKLVLATSTFSSWNYVTFAFVAVWYFDYTITVWYQNGLCITLCGCGVSASCDFWHPCCTLSPHLSLTLYLTLILWAVVSKLWGKCWSAYIKKTQLTVVCTWTFSITKSGSHSSLVTVHCTLDF